MITQLAVLLLFLEPLGTASSTPDGHLLPISSATAKTFHPNQRNPPEAVFDGRSDHKQHPSLTGWWCALASVLVEEEDHKQSRKQFLKIPTIFRLDHHVGIIERLLGTHVYLYHADGTTRIADCGKITKVNTANGWEISQTYTLPCDSSQLASYVKLEDSEPVADDQPVFMNIAEVKVYGRSFNGGK
eukprot:sb/3471335/